MTDVIVHTGAQFEVVDVTDEIARQVAIGTDGLALVYLRHTTAALFLGPNDEGMRRDYLRAAEDWLAGLRPFDHIENNNPNGEAHLLSSFGGVQLTIPIAAGKLDLGTWQRVLLLELDGPQRRTVCVRLFPWASGS